MANYVNVVFYVPADHFGVDWADATYVDKARTTYLTCRVTKFLPGYVTKPRKGGRPKTMVDTWFYQEVKEGGELGHAFSLSWGTLVLLMFVCITHLFFCKSCSRLTNPLNFFF